jgi:hypothetical protein
MHDDDRLSKKSGTVRTVPKSRYFNAAFPIALRKATRNAAFG